MVKGPKASRGRQGLRKMPTELIVQAQDQTASTIARIMLTFVGVTLFCLLTLLTPDVALLTSGERLNVPFAGPVSFLGFILVGPAVLIALRVYLQIYVEHWRRLEPIQRRLQARWVPTVAPLQNPLLRGFAGSVLYLLLPLTMLAFTWKAAVLSAWGAGLVWATIAVTAVAVTAGHLMLPLPWSWRGRTLVAVAVALLVATMIYIDGPLRRSAHLYRADLSNQWLAGSDLRGANLELANLAGAHLSFANLEGANLAGANLAGAQLFHARIEGASFGKPYIDSAVDWSFPRPGANLSSANLQFADISSANLEGADLRGANLIQAGLAGANLAGANLAGADLRFAHLNGANLEGADLRGADLEGAGLEGVNLMDAKRLTQAQLDQACGNDETKLPSGLKPGTNCWPGAE